ncbi:hypothetical protein QQP08_017428 [Theobroma cacao]|nr:hypothetical protein QQP08_017428 [Theobroma cacao]
MQSHDINLGHGQFPSQRLVSFLTSFSTQTSGAIYPVIPEIASSTWDLPSGMAMESENSLSLAT